MDAVLPIYEKSNGTAFEVVWEARLHPLLHQ